MKTNFFNETDVAAASASINKTIDDIEKLLQGDELTKGGKLRQKLRAQLHDALSTVAHEWLEHGFNGGHRVAAKRFIKTGKFPKSISANIKRKFPVLAVSKDSVEISLKSKLKPDQATELDDRA